MLDEATHCSESAMMVMLSDVTGGPAEVGDVQAALLQADTALLQRLLQDPEARVEHLGSVAAGLAVAARMHLVAALTETRRSAVPVRHDWPLFYLQAAEMAADVMRMLAVAAGGHPRESDEPLAPPPPLCATHALGLNNWGGALASGDLFQSSLAFQERLQGAADEVDAARDLVLGTFLAQVGRFAKGDGAALGLDGNSRTDRSTALQSLAVDGSVAEVIVESLPSATGALEVLQGLGLECDPTDEELGPAGRAQQADRSDRLRQAAKRSGLQSYDSPEDAPAPPSQGEGGDAGVDDEWQLDAEEAAAMEEAEERGEAAASQEGLMASALKARAHGLAALLCLLRLPQTRLDALAQQPDSEAQMLILEQRLGTGLKAASAGLELLERARERSQERVNIAEEAETSTEEQQDEAGVMSTAMEGDLDEEEEEVEQWPVAVQASEVSTALCVGVLGALRHRGGDAVTSEGLTASAADSVRAAIEAAGGVGAAPADLVLLAWFLAKERSLIVGDWDRRQVEAQAEAARAVELEGELRRRVPEWHCDDDSDVPLALLRALSVSPADPQVGASSLVTESICPF